MPSNIGNQTVNVKYFDSVLNSKVNAIGMQVRRPGVYVGGHITKSNDTTVLVSTPLTAEIVDSGSTAFEQVSITAAGYTTNGTSVPVTVATSSNYAVILTWTYTGSASADYMQFLGVPFTTIAALQASYPNCVVLGVCNSGAGAGWTGIDYTYRSDPNVFNHFLKVEAPEATDPSQMQVRIRGGRVNYGTANYQVVDQLSPTLVAPGSGSYIALIQVSSSFTTTNGINYAVLATPTYGSATAGTPVAPSYNGLVTLAEVTLVSGQTSIIQSNIKDVRGWVSGAVPPNTYVDLISAQSVGGNKTFTGVTTASGGLVIPAVTSDPGSPVAGQIWLRTDF